VGILLDFRLLLSNQHKLPLPECSLKIQQEPKPYQLIATGSLTKDGIELPLESLLRKVNKDVDIMAEQLTGHSDKWIITTSPDGNVSQTLNQTLIAFNKVCRVLLSGRPG